MYKFTIIVTCGKKKYVNNIKLCHVLFLKWQLAQHEAGVWLQGMARCAVHEGRDEERLIPEILQTIQIRLSRHSKLKLQGGSWWKSQLSTITNTYIIITEVALTICQNTDKQKELHLWSSLLIANLRYFQLFFFFTLWQKHMEKMRSQTKSSLSLKYFAKDPLYIA